MSTKPPIAERIPSATARTFFMLTRAPSQPARARGRARACSAFEAWPSRFRSMLTVLASEASFRSFGSSAGSVFAARSDVAAFEAALWRYPECTRVKIRVVLPATRVPPQQRALGGQGLQRLRLLRERLGAQRAAAAAAGGQQADRDDGDEGAARVIRCRHSRISLPGATIFGTSPSSRMSTTARRRSWTRCSGSPARSAPTRTWPSACSTRWTSSARRASRSSPRTRPSRSARRR